MKNRHALTEILFEDPNRIAVRPAEPATENGARLQRLDGQGGSRLSTGLWLAFGVMVTAASLGLWTFIFTGLWRLAVYVIGLAAG